MPKLNLKKQLSTTHTWLERLTILEPHRFTIFEYYRKNLQKLVKRTAKHFGVTESDIKDIIIGEPFKYVEGEQEDIYEN